MPGIPEILAGFFNLVQDQQAGSLNERNFQRIMGLTEGMGQDAWGRGLNYGGATPVSNRPGSERPLSPFDAEWWTGPGSILGGGNLNPGSITATTTGGSDYNRQTGQLENRWGSQAGAGGTSGGFAGQAYDSLQQEHDDLVGGYSRRGGRANRMSSDVAQDVNQRFKGVTSRARRGGKSLRDEVSRGYGGLENLIGSGYEGVVGGYGSRQQQVMDLVSQLGGQERKDIMDTSRESLQSDLQGLTNRGLGSTTLTSAARRGSQEEQTDALGRFRERDISRKADYLSDLSGDTLRAQEHGILNRASARQAGLGADERIGAGNLNRNAMLGESRALAAERGGNRSLATYLGTSADRLNAGERGIALGERRTNRELNDMMQQYLAAISGISGVSIPYSQGGPLGPWMQSRAAEDAARAQQQPSPWDSFGNAFSTGTATALGTTAGAAINPINWFGP